MIYLVGLIVGILASVYLVLEIRLMLGLDNQTLWQRISRLWS